MNEERTRMQIQQLFETTLSGLQEDPWLAQRVLHAADGKGKLKMKKKLSTSMILALVLMLVTLTAVALGLGIDEIWKNSFEKMNTTGEIYTISYPDEDDMTAEEAIAIARAAIVAAYGTTDAEFDRMGVYPTFLAREWHVQSGDDPAEWRILFSSRTDVNLDLDYMDYGPDGEYRVYLNAETEEILLCNWYTNDFWSKAQRIWDCGNYEDVYWHYNKPDFYSQTAEQQAYWTKLLRDKGYEVRTEDEKYTRLMLSARLELLFAEVDEILDADDPQVAAAWHALEQTCGLSADLMQTYAFGATRPGWNTGTEDICITFKYEEEFLRQELGEFDHYCGLIFTLAKRAGMFMVSFEPGTTNVVKVTHVLNSAEERTDSITTGRLLEKNDWTAADLVAFDQAMQQLKRAVKRMQAAGMDRDIDFVARDFINQLGGEAEYYPAAPVGMNTAQWFADESEYDASIIDMSVSVTQARQLYGNDRRFWPVEVQAALLSAFSAPLPGEMTEEEAVAFAVQAVIDQLGQEAIDKLGDYVAGCQLYRFEADEGVEATRWHVFLTDDAATAEKGWQVIFAFREGEPWGSVQVQDILEGGVG